MALVNLDLTGAYAISRGYEWRLNLYHPGNVVNAALFGQIWSAYEPDSGLAQFTFERAAYDPQTGLTRFPIVLSAFVTRNLLPTGSGFYVYEVRLLLPRRNPQPVLAGKVHVLHTIAALQ